MATEAAWLKRNRLMEKRKRKCALTPTGLLMEGPNGKRGDNRITTLCWLNS